MTNATSDDSRQEACAGAIVFDDARRLLVIRRGQEPSIGLWSVPGGRCEPGESAADACIREVAEETGMVVRVVRHAGTVHRPGPGGVRYDIDDFVCELVDGTLTAGDDAVEARWVSAHELGGLGLVPGLVECLTEWDAMPS